jgi:hypothetical protein
LWWEFVLGGFGGLVMGLLWLSWLFVWLVDVA